MTERGTGLSIARVPLGAYVHLPWCVAKCPYCDFNSHRAPAELPERAYVDALLADFARDATGENRAVTSVFFGGGTPSLFSAHAIARVLEAIDAGPGLAGDCEITLEANPGTLEHGRFAEFAAAGVNRLSLGIQSLDDACLTALGRIHDAGAAHAAIDEARAAGFAHINCDLMYGLPGQTHASGLADVDGVLAHDIDHVSYYQLTLEPGTPFYRRPPPRPDDDAVADLFDAAAERLTAAGYARYEVSAWARPGGACRHNDNIWRFGDYLGIGAGAHGKRTRADGRIERTAKMRWPTGYMQAAPAGGAVVERRGVDAEDRRFECLLGGLRRRAGIARADYERHTGLAWPALLAHADTPLADALLEIEADHLRASALGWRYLDAVLTDLLPEATSHA